MIKRLIALAFALALSNHANAQSWTQLQWGVNNKVNPYQVGVNLAGSWYQVATLTPAGALSLAFPAYSCASSQWVSASNPGGVICSQPSFSNISGTIAASQLIAPGASTFGAVKSSAAPSNQFATGINTSGVVTYSAIGAGAMPAFIGGDCTTSAGSVALACTKTNGVSFGFFATGTDAGNLTGTLPLSTIPGSILVGSSGTPGSIYSTSAAGVATGLSYTSKVNGSGGTNGTYNVTVASSGGGTNAVVQVVISGGAISGTPSVTTAGSNFTGTKTISNADIVAAGATGLTGASITLTAGGGVPFGAYYWVISSSPSGALDLYANVAGVATTQSKTTAADDVAQTVGTYPAASGGTGWNADYTYCPAVAAGASGVVSGFSMNSSGLTGYIVVATKDVSNNFTIVSQTPFTATTGVYTNTRSAIPVTAGQYVCIYAANANLTYYAGATGVYYMPGLPTTSTASTLNPSINISFSYTISDGLKQTANTAYVSTTALSTQISQINSASIINYSGVATSMAPNVGIIGDSIIARADTSSAGATLSDAVGELNWAHAAFPSFNKDTWINGSDPLGRGYVGANQGLSGDTLQSIAATPSRMAALGSQALDAIILAAGTNDVFGNGRSAVQVEADFATVATQALSYTPRLVVATIRPLDHSYGTWTSGKETVRQAVNTWIRNYAATTPGVRLWDADKALDPSATGSPASASYLIDGLHLNTQGAQISGATSTYSLANVLKQMFKPYRAWPYDTLNILPNPSLVNSAGTGTAGTGVTGTVADAMRVYRASGASTAVASLVAQSDGTNAQQIIITPSGAGTADRFIFEVTNTAFPFPASMANGWARCWAKVGYSSWNGWNSSSLLAPPYIYALNSASTDNITGGATLTIVSDPILLPGSPSGIHFFLDTYINAAVATGTGTLTVYKAGCAPEADPRPLRNQ